MKAITTILFGCLIILSSCATGRINPFLSQSPDTGPSIQDNKKGEKKTEKVLAKLWSERHEAESLSRYIETAKTVTRSPTDSRERWLRLARAEYLVAEFHTDSGPERLRLYLSAAHRAEAVLHLNLAYRDAVSRPRASPEDGLSAIDRPDLDAAHWFAESLYRWSVESGPERELKHRRTVNSFFNHIEKVDPGFHHGAADRHFAIEHARSRDGDPESWKRSRARFDAVVRQHGDYFANPVAFARYYARPPGDEVLFRKLIDRVLKESAATPADSIPEQILEQKRAKALSTPKKAP
jgi:hypothetical protein